MSLPDITKSLDPSLTSIVNIPWLKVSIEDSKNRFGVYFNNILPAAFMCATQKPKNYS